MKVLRYSQENNLYTFLLEVKGIYFQRGFDRFDDDKHNKGNGLCRGLIKGEGHLSFLSKSLDMVSKSSINFLFFLLVEKNSNCLNMIYIGWICYNADLLLFFAIFVVFAILLL